MANGKLAISFEKLLLPMSTILHFVCILGLFAIALLSKVSHKSILHPSTFFAGYWFTVLATTRVVGNDLTYWWGGALFISASSLAIFLGSLIPIQSFSKRQKYQFKTVSTQQNQARTSYFSIWTVSICVIISCAGILSLLLDSGYSINTLFSEAVLSLSNELSKSRYSDDYQLPLSFRITLIPAWFSCLVSGAVFRITKERKLKFVLLLPILVSCISGFIQGSRSGIFISLFFFAATYLTTSAYHKFPSFRINPRTITTTCIVSVMIFVIAATIQSLRNQKTISDYAFILDKSRITLFGGIPNFSNWLEKTYDDQNLLTPETNGYYTFTGAFDLAGIQKREKGIYTEYSDIRGFSTNIYTYFRGLITDLGLLLYFPFLVLLGTLASLSFKPTTQGNSLCSTITTCFYAFTLWNVISIYSYNSIILSFLIYGFYHAFYIKPSLRKL